ncbi:MAG: lysylphosphatidylglycerol synthase transmembrane domain-containing protein [Candidatus Caldarchaeum sp.]|nr:lysylphosphatidylglycerol synthase transmembrane domain-containing protein [Candidatus Caldarchaeum sp.]
MSRKYLTHAIAGILLSSAIFAIVFNLFKISLEELLSVNPLVFWSVMALNGGRFAAQGLRFHLLLRKFSNASRSYFDSLLMRGASEFFALTTIPFMADEAARTWLLTQRGETATKAFMIALTEMLLDIDVGGTIALAAGLYAASAKAANLSLIIVLVSSTQLCVAALLLVLSKNPNLVKPMQGFLPLPIPSRIRELLLNSSEEMKKVIGTTFSKSFRNSMIMLLLSTVVVMSAPAIVLQILLGYPDVSGFFACLLSFHSGNALGVLPVTVGGAGLTEAGVYLYLSSVFGVNSPATTMQWRLATYYVSLVISSLMFIVVVARQNREHGKPV